MNGSASRRLSSDLTVSRWERNAEAVRRISRRPIAGLPGEGAGPLEILPARSGPPTLRYRGEFIHSPFHPILEAKGLAQAAVDGAADLVIVLGLGLGYHVRELLDRTSSRVIVYEPDRHLMAALMRRIDYGALFVPGRVILAHDEDHLVEALEASLRIGVRALWVTLPGYEKLFPEEVGRARRCASYRLSMFRRQVESPIRESRDLLLRSLDNLPWLWKGRWAKPRADRQAWLNGVVLNKGCAGRLPPGLVGVIESRTMVVTTSGAGSGFRPHLRIGPEATSGHDAALQVLPLDAPPSAFAAGTERPIVYTRLHDAIGEWAAGVLFGDSASQRLPLGLSTAVDAALLCGQWFDRVFWVDPAPIATSDPEMEDRIADRRFLAEFIANRRGSGGVKLMLGRGVEGEKESAAAISPEELYAELAALPAEDWPGGGGLSEKFLADVSVDRESLNRLCRALVCEKDALREFSGRLGGLLEKWGIVRHPPSGEEPASIREEKRLVLESYVAELGETASSSRLVSAVAKPLMLEVLRPWEGSSTDTDRHALHLASTQAFLVSLVRDLPAMGTLLEGAIFEVLKSERHSV